MTTKPLSMFLSFALSCALMAAICGRPSTLLPAASTIALFLVLCATFDAIVRGLALARDGLRAWRDNRRAWSALVESQREREACSCALPSPPFASQDGRLFCLLCRREARPSEASR